MLMSFKLEQLACGQICPEKDFCTTVQSEKFLVAFINPIANDGSSGLCIATQMNTALLLSNCLLIGLCTVHRYGTGMAVSCMKKKR